MKRFNLYFPGEILPPGAKWITMDAIREIVFVEPGPEMFGGVIPSGMLAAKPTLYKRPPRKRGWMERVMERVMAQARMAGPDTRHVPGDAGNHERGIEWVPIPNTGQSLS